MQEWHQKNQPNLKIQVKIFLKCPFWSIATKLENIWTKIFLQEVGQESCGWNSICQILILPLWLATAPWFLVKTSQILKQLMVFFPKSREKIKTLDSLTAEVFPQYCLFFSILAIFRRKSGVKIGPVYFP